ncbi:hypothetical protein N0V93_003606 [Gnomoniopsis smithogilvyi]|uniref:Rhodopsin domain-containing protein n=1 Tax=Gnomoniopsis smithogilvyi TaxID=1191159 RepID=A0A9W8YYP8_9PEZI|nr:hypothetical protein N0V93_003606 [Gnomoniopsis smithogilvyi]
MTTYRESLIVAMALFLLLDTIVIGARLYVRTRILSRAFGRDDFVLCLTYIGYVIHCGFEVASIHYGYAAPEGEHRPYYDMTRATKLLFGNQLAIYICAGTVKLGVAFVLLRLVTKRGIRILLYGSMVVVIAWTIVMTLYASYLCVQSGSSNWAGSKTCEAVGYFRTSSNIVIDYFYAFLPIYILWDVQMSLKLKLSVLLLLGLGAFASAATIVKLVIIVRLQTAKGSAASALHYELLLWADIELGIALFAAASAALRPLVKSVPSAWNSYFSTRTKVTKYFSKPSIQSTRHTSSSASHLQGTGAYVEVGAGGVSDEDFQMNHLSLMERESALEGSIVKTTTVAVKTECRCHQRASSAPVDVGAMV